MKKAALLLALLCAAPGAGAQEAPETIAIPFAPPTVRDLIYDLVRQEDVQGKPVHFTIRRTLRFEPQGRGYILTSTITSFDTDAPADIARGFEAGTGALLDQPVRMLVSPEGKLLGVINLDAVWTHVEEVKAALLAAHDGDKTPLAAAIATLFDVPEAGRADFIKEDVAPLFLFAACRIDGAKPRVVEQARDLPGAGSVPFRGSVVLAGQAEGELMLHEELAADLDGAEGPLRGYATRADYKVDLSTGLVADQHGRSDMALSAGDRTSIRTANETRLLRLG